MRLRLYLRIVTLLLKEKNRPRYTTTITLGGSASSAQPTSGNGPLAVWGQVVIAPRQTTIIKAASRIFDCPWDRLPFCQESEIPRFTPQLKRYDVLLPFIDSGPTVLPRLSANIWSWKSSSWLGNQTSLWQPGET